MNTDSPVLREQNNGTRNNFVSFYLYIEHCNLDGQSFKLKIFYKAKELSYVKSGSEITGEGVYTFSEGSNLY